MVFLRKGEKMTFEGLETVFYEVVIRFFTKLGVFRGRLCMVMAGQLRNYAPFGSCLKVHVFSSSYNGAVSGLCGYRYF